MAMGVSDEAAEGARWMAEKGEELAQARSQMWTIVFHVNGASSASVHRVPKWLACMWGPFNKVPFAAASAFFLLLLCLNALPCSLAIAGNEHFITLYTSLSRKLAKLAGVTLAIARFLSIGCKS